MQIEIATDDFDVCNAIGSKATMHRLCITALLKSIWICTESLIHIVQVIYSTIIDENDLQNLEYWTEIHLQEIQQCLKKELIRKHHFMTHYAIIIRKMGPIKPISMVRFEVKHKALKAYGVQTQNFINIIKTISERHQQHNCVTENLFTDRNQSIFNFSMIIKTCL